MNVERLERPAIGLREAINNLRAQGNRGERAILTLAPRRTGLPK
jgi:hypothetical protein